MDMHQLKTILKIWVQSWCSSAQVHHQRPLDAPHFGPDDQSLFLGIKKRASADKAFFEAMEHRIMGICTTIDSSSPKP